MKVHQYYTCSKKNSTRYDHSIARTVASAASNIPQPASHKLERSYFLRPLPASISGAYPLAHHRGLQHKMPGNGWAVSYSAPAFFPNDEQDEKDNLSPEENKLIEDELHGAQVFDFDSFETPGQISEGLDVLHQCLKNLDPKLTATYFEALEKVPELVRRETDPIMFLRAEHYDAERAASRLAMHWKERKMLFGEDRAYLPMTLAPKGAMGSSGLDMEQLELGYVARVPDDHHGRPVIFLDRSNSTKAHNYQRDCWLRVMWYMVHVICTNPEYQRSGYVVIINLKDYNPAQCGDRLGAKKMFLYIRECWCPRFKGYHATYGSHQTPVKLVGFYSLASLFLFSIAASHTHTVIPTGGTCDSKDARTAH